MATIIIDPVTRLEGHLKMSITLDSANRVTDAAVSGNLFRDFENLLKSRTPKDASYLTQRICGVCPVPHAIASAKSVEAAAGKTVPLQGLMLRNIIQGANFIDSNILHFYQLALLDYVTGPSMSPWASGYTQDFRFGSSDTQTFNTNYIKALSIRKKAHQLGAIFGGKMPHAASIVPGGCTAKPTSTDISNAKSLLSEIKSFVTGQYYSDVNKLASTYSDYMGSYGAGFGNLICYGVFDTNTSGGKLIPSGVLTGGASSAFNAANIKEYVGKSWYSSPTGQAPASGTTTVSYGKAGAYSYIKAPRYSANAYEAGPLARMKMKGSGSFGISVMDRHLARYKETELLTSSMLDWLNALSTTAAGTVTCAPSSGTGVGLTEAPRGALGHWTKIASSKISNYQIITPTCWNASPLDDSGVHGPIERALEGITIANPSQPVEALRIVHSFDPCTGCSVHVLSPEGIEMSKYVLRHPGM